MELTQADGLKTNPASGQKSARKTGLEARLVATLLVTRIVDDKRNLDALCDASHGLKAYLQLDPRDRALARAIAVTALRHRTNIEVVLAKLLDRAPPKRARFLIHSLHVAAAQVLYLDLPDSAAVDLGVSAIGDDERTSRFRSMANAVLRRMVREKETLTETQIRSPFPKWFESKLRSDFGRDKSTQIAEMVLKEPLVDITVKSDPGSWAEKLGGIALPGGTVRLLTRESIQALEGYDDGEWWVQDAAAALPARLIGEGTGQKTLELCAAPGGKTAQLANAGHQVTALDISAPRLKRLGENLKRLKLAAELVEADMLEWQPDNLFDAVLLDAPCSSTGTVRRHPDVLWTKSAEDVTALANLQFELLDRARSFVKPGGVLVFSNCSLFKEEGEALLVRALKTFDDLELVPVTQDDVPDLPGSINGQGALRTLPFHLPRDPVEQGGLDGFFACRFRKK